MTALTPMLADMLHNAMPVVEKINSPERQGMMTPDDNRELVSRMLAPVLSELAGVPSIHAIFEAMGEGLIRCADELARQSGRLMTDAPLRSAAPDARASTPTPETPNEPLAPDAGRE